MSKIRQNSSEDKFGNISSRKLENSRTHHCLRLINSHIREEHQILTIFQKYQPSEIISHPISSGVNLTKIIKCKTIRSKTYNKKCMSVRRITV